MVEIKIIIIMLLLLLFFRGGDLQKKLSLLITTNFFRGPCKKHEFLTSNFIRENKAENLLYVAWWTIFSILN